MSRRVRPGGRVAVCPSCRSRIAVDPRRADEGAVAECPECGAWIEPARRRPRRAGLDVGRDRAGDVEDWEESPPRRAA